MNPTSNKKDFEDLTTNLKDLAFGYIEKYSPSKQQLKVFLLKKYLTKIKGLQSKKEVSSIIDEIILNLEKNKLIKTKNKSGKAERYTIQLDANVSIKNLNNMKIINKSFNQTIDYNVQSNHFDTINEENSVKTIAAEKIAEDIVKYLMLSYNN